MPGQQPDAPARLPRQPSPTDGPCRAPSRVVTHRKVSSFHSSSSSHTRMSWGTLSRVANSLRCSISRSCRRGGAHCESGTCVGVGGRSSRCRPCSACMSPAPRKPRLCTAQNRSNHTHQGRGLPLRPRGPRPRPALPTHRAVLGVQHSQLCEDAHVRALQPNAALQQRDQLLIVPARLVEVRHLQGGWGPRAAAAVRSTPAGAEPC